MIKNGLKWISITLLMVVLVFIASVIFRQHNKYEAPYPEIHASKDSTIIANGKYLFYGPAHCLDCHTNSEGYPRVVNGEKLPPSGGLLFSLPIGDLHSPNITSDMVTGIGKMTDGEIARTLRYGVGSDGRSIIDFMPFHNTSDEDLTAIISYLRTIPSVRNEVPRMKFNLLGMVINAFVLKPVGPTGDVPVSIKRELSIEYGRYLARSVANCRGCHTNRNLMTGAFIGEDFAGGFKMPDQGKPGFFVVSRNLTPDPKTGRIYNWSEDAFVARLRAGKVIKESQMPWGPFKNMSDDDLRSIYRYLKTVKPVCNDPGPVEVADN